MYVAVKGGEKAIEAAHQLQENLRRGDETVPALSAEQIGEQLGLAVDRVMTEGGIYDRQLAALAIKQASGDLVEAIFLLRAYRTTLPRLAVSEPLASENMRLERRISAVYKDLPGGQVLGPTYDYTHRLLDFALLVTVKHLRHHRPMSRYQSAAPTCSTCLISNGWRWQKKMTAAPRTILPATRRSIPARARRAYSNWCVAMRAFCWH